MTQSNIDDKFLNGLHLMIDSIESSYLQKADDDDDVKERVSHNGDRPHLPKEKRPLDTTISGGGEIKHQRHIQNADEDDLPKADHWCPDVKEWHTSDHEPAEAPSVHVNVDNDNGDDPYQTENGSDTGAWDDASKDEDLEKQASLLAAAGRAAAPAIGQAVGEKVGSKIKGEGVEKISVAATLKDVEHGRDRIESEYDQNTNLDRHEQENSPDSIAEPFLNRYDVRDDEEEEEGEDVEKQWEAEEHEQEAGENIDIAPRGKGVATEARGRQGRLPKAAQRLPGTKQEFAEFDRDIGSPKPDVHPDSYVKRHRDADKARAGDVEKSHHDEQGGSHQVRRKPQPPEDPPKRIPGEDEEPKKGPLEMSFDKSNDFIESLVQTHAKSIDILKIWGSVDRVLPKTSSDISLLTDIDILKSFDLDETTNVEDLIEGTLVYKMLVDRASRPTSEWWDSSMLMAKSINVVDEPAFFSAFLYYEPETFDITDFIEVSKAEVTQGKPHDLEEMPNTSGGSAIDGLGMSDDGYHGPEDDEDCD